MERLSIRTPARLHFGLLEIMKDQPYRFGGLGLMIASPAFHIEMRANLRFDLSETGCWESRMEAICHQWAAYRKQAQLPSVSIRILESLPSHRGFGSGTQLACATATLLDTFAQRDRLSMEARSLPCPVRSLSQHRSFEESLQDLKQLVRRGERSQIGLAGFLEGGFLFDKGGSSGRSDVERFVAPDEWRVLLVHPSETESISGQLEADYFVRCESSPNPHRDRMLQLLAETIIPALIRGELSMMSEALYEYGALSGEIFRQVQYSEFRTKEIAERVARLRSLGVQAVGQSSWGPIVFGIVDEEAKALSIVKSWNETARGSEISISRISRQGAVIDWMLE